MATFNYQDSEFTAWKKIQYKDGIVKVDFMDGDGHLITVKGGEIPHPDFRTKFGQLKSFIDIIINSVTNITEPICLSYPDNGKLQITARIRTNYAGAEIKTEILDYSDIQEWDFGHDEATGESKLLKLCKEINTEAHAYIFKNKTAQTEIEFPELKHDGMDVARAILKIADQITE